MDIRLGSVQPDSNRYSDTPSKKKRLKTKGPHAEEVWSERSDYEEIEEIEDVYTPSARSEEEAGE